jgi:16S rRNA (adenine1518-N6/adenine1519-N6)-dimethyltransferase
LRARKSLGQHFLRDRSVIQRIIAAVNPQPGDRILEIGPGDGALTLSLAAPAETLVAVEIDERAVRRIQRLTAGTNIQILHADILTVDLEVLASAGGSRKPLRVVGNIPYNITSPILFRLLDFRESVQDATLMMQREVARRLASPPGNKEYGIPSVIGGLLADIEMLFDVPPGAFVPRPKVTSTVLRLVPLRETRFAVADLEFFRSMVRFVFGQRRKTLRNSLRSFLGDLAWSPPHGFDLQQRPEECDLETLVRLSNHLVRERVKAGSARPAAGTP